MELSLNGAFWGPWIRRVFMSEIDWMRRSVFDHILPSFPDPKVEGDKAAGAAWEEAMSQPSNGSDDPGDDAVSAEDAGEATYMGIVRMRQSAANLSAVMLWHLLEQQMLTFLMRQVLSVHEERDARKHPESRNRLFNLEVFHERLKAGGCSMRDLHSWPKVNELRLVANAIKHGPGKSLDELFAIRPDMLTQPDASSLFFPFRSNPAWVEKPAVGEDIYVAEADLTAYFDAGDRLWHEFSLAIEKF